MNSSSLTTTSPWSRAPRAARIWGGDRLTDWDSPFWEHDLHAGLGLHRQAVETHLITSWHAAPLMVRAGRGLIIAGVS